MKRSKDECGAIERNEREMKEKRKEMERNGSEMEEK